MTKKTFDNLTNPADSLLNNINAASTETQKKDTPKGRPAKDASESRSQHASFLLKPSTANSLKYIAKFENISVNEIANNLLDKYVTDYRKNPEQASKLDQALNLFK